ncbi:hypothetical protein ACS0TY_020280 [Phlomoides rotata]
MEGRMNKYRQLSPERAIVWTEKSPKYQQQQQQHHEARKVPVVYYLCKNQQLEHPHFMEVPLSSSGDLYLRDVIERLNVLRGRGIASMYSWSCKRSYKNGYVWHDLCDNDIVHPAHGNDYILKGAEIFQESNPGPTQTQKALPEPPFFRSKEGPPSPSSLNGRATKGAQNDELSPLLLRPCSSAMSPESIVRKKSSFNGSLNLTEYNKSDGLANASALTEEKDNRVVGRRSMCTRGVSTDDGLSEPNENQVSQYKDEASAPPSAAAAQTDTLESLVRADIRRILEEEGCRIPSRTKLKVANTIVQLISCGSISVKDHKFPLMLGEVNSSCSMGMRLKDKQYFCGSIAETSMPKEDVPTLKRSSYNADSFRSNKENVIKSEES